MNKISMIMLVAFAAIVLTMLPDLAQAQTGGTGGGSGTGSANAGSELLTNTLGMIKGSLGTLIGLGIALFGLYMWLIQQASWGIMVMIGGVALTAFPGLFDWMRTGFSDAAGGNASTSTSTNIQ